MDTSIGSDPGFDPGTGLGVNGQARLLAHADEIRLHLRSILASPPFRSSGRSQKFLDYVVNRVLIDQAEPLKERTVGVEVFGRPPDYDTGDDAIVRVTAREVRRRLQKYYAGSGPAAGWRIDIPTGSYVPEFHFIESRSPDGSPARRARLSARLNGLPWRRLGWAALAPAWLALGWLLGGHVRSRPKAPADAGPVAAQAAFYRDLLAPIIKDRQHPVEIALSNPRVFLYDGAASANGWRARTPLSAPVPAPLQHRLDRTADAGVLASPYRRLDFAPLDYTGMGEAVSAFAAGQLLQAQGRPSQLIQARFLNWENARSRDLVLLGAPHMSAWVRQSLGSADFSFTQTAILNAHPGPGEKPAYVLRYAPNQVTDYALIWMTRSPSGRPILLLAGLLSVGTAGAGDFLGNPRLMRPVYEHLRALGHGSVPPRWQVLLKVTARDGIPVDETAIAWRAY